MDKDDPKHQQSQGAGNEVQLVNQRLRRGRRSLHLSLNHARAPACRLFAKPRHLTADRNYQQLVECWRLCPRRATVYLVCRSRKQLFRSSVLTNYRCLSSSSGYILAHIESTTALVHFILVGFFCGYFFFTQQLTTFVLV